MFSSGKTYIVGLQKQRSIFYNTGDEEWTSEEEFHRCYGRFLREYLLDNRGGST